MVVQQATNAEDQSPENLAAIADVFEMIAEDGGVVLDNTVSSVC